MKVPSPSSIRVAGEIERIRRTICDDGYSRVDLGLDAEIRAASIEMLNVVAKIAYTCDYEIITADSLSRVQSHADLMRLTGRWNDEMQSRCEPRPPAERPDA